MGNRIIGIGGTLVGRPTEPGARPGPQRQARGIALVSVLWTLILLSAVAAGVSATVRNESRHVRNLLSATQSQYAAQGAIELAVLNLLAPMATRWPADGSVQHASIADARLRIAVFNENGKVDLNFAQQVLLDAVLTGANMHVEQRAALVDAIMDWRDGDDLRRLNGAEDSDYADAGKSYGAKDARFETVEELLLVLGMTPAIYESVAPLFTVYSRQPIPDPAFVPSQLRDFITELGSSSPDTTESVYTVHVEARVGDDVMTQLVATIVLAPGYRQSPYRILGWKQPLERLFSAEHDDSRNDPTDFSAGRVNGR